MNKRKERVLKKIDQNTLLLIYPGKSFFYKKD